MCNLEELDYHQLAQLRDACNRQMLRLHRTTGLRLPDLLDLLERVKLTLSDQGKEWRSLERWQWIDGEIRFWLNPADQHSYRMGWFSIDELIQWASNIGPVMLEDDEPEEALEVPAWAVWHEARALDLAA
ncbi:MAG: hypothetical protein HGA45_34120 [Chloroflexales bacterium]|nr:hypothetical protein [Chloroflexales bacterium]